MNAVQHWYNSLQKREQYLVSATAALLVVMLFFLLIWEPLFNNIEEQQSRLSIQKKTLSWMQDAEQQVAELKQSGNIISPAITNSSISTLAERSLISAGIRTAVDKMETTGSAELKVQFKTVDFDRLIQWLGNLQNSYGIASKHVTINHTEQSGQVSARVTLEKISS